MVAKVEIVKPGDWMAAAVTPEAAPRACYVGTVQKVDYRGVRLTLVDWFVRQAVGFDMYLPWASITASLLATADDDADLFLENAAKFQAEVERRRKATGQSAA